jgi:predicted MFS family arabinose efflux permease
MTSRRLIALAVTLSLGAALSLGLARFAYALLLPPMRDALHWSYALAGLMNTANAVGYLVGALMTPLLLRRLTAPQVLMAGATASCIVMAVSAFFVDTTAWLLLRAAAGVFSAWVFMTGGMLAARLGSEQPQRAGLVIALFYAGTGVGITASALGVPATLAWQSDGAAGLPAWAWGWVALAVACVLCTLALAWPARVMAAQAARAAQSGAAHAASRARPWHELAPGLASYLCFGMGYIGYMTFSVALLREQGASAAQITVYFALLGLAVMASGPLWANLLARHRDGRPALILNTLLGAATALAAASDTWGVMLISGALFGGCFLQVVGSTTALVRHQWPPDQWARGIAWFTIVFAAGQIVGPALVGAVADAGAGLQGGLWVSAGVLWLGAAMATMQQGPRDA